MKGILGCNKRRAVAAQLYERKVKFMQGNLDKMSIEGFCMCIKIDLNNRLSKTNGNKYDLELKKVVKPNDIEMFGICFHKEGDNVSPTLYVNGFYEAYCDDVITIEEVESHLLRQLERAFKDREKVILDDIYDFEVIKDKVFFKVMSLANNTKYLQDAIYIPYLDMAIVFYLYLYEDEDGVASSKIMPLEFNMWGITREELFSIAKENTKRLFPYIFGSVKNILFEMGVDVGEETPLYCLTNKKKINGASCILYDGVLKECSKTIGGSFYILPSSIHEILLVKVEEDEYQLDFLKSMVAFVNESDVSTRDMLTNNVYFYDCDKDKLTLV
jgi:hypothetical protein